VEPGQAGHVDTAPAGHVEGITGGGHVEPGEAGHVEVPLGGFVNVRL